MTELSAAYLSVCSNASEGGGLTEAIWTPADRNSVMVSAVFSMLFLLLGLPLNLLVLLTILLKRLHTQPTTILLFNLVLSDLILLLLVMPFHIVTGLADEFAFGSSDWDRCRTCIASGVLTTLFVLNSVFTIAMLSFDRFFFIYRPLHYRRIITPLKTAVMVTLTWLVSIIVASIPAFGLGDIAFHVHFVLCLPEFYGYFMLLFLVVTVPLLVIMVCNIWVICIVFKNIKKIYEVRRSLSTDAERREKALALARKVKKKRHQKQLYTLRIFGGLICSNIILWPPLVLLAIYRNTLEAEFTVPTMVYTATFTVFFAQALVHPFLETILLSDIREPIKKRLLWCCRCRQYCDGFDLCGCDCGCGLLTLCTAAVLPEENNDQTCAATQDTSEAIL